MCCPPKGLIFLGAARRKISYSGAIKNRCFSGFFMPVSVFCSPALHTVNVSRTIWRAACALALPHHLPQAVHRFMMRIVQGVKSCCQQFNRLANAAWLVNRTLLADGQVHRQVQERIRPAALHVVHLCQCRICIGKIGMVFRVLSNPLACYYFKSFQRFT